MKQNEKGTPKGTLKRGFAALLTSCMCVSMVPADAFAAELQQEGYKALDMQLDAEGDIKAEKVSYSLAADTTVYLTAGQQSKLTLKSGAEEITPADWMVEGVDGADKAKCTVDSSNNVKITYASGVTNVGNTYHVYPRVLIDGKETVAKDSNGNELYYTVVYLGEVKIKAPKVTEVKENTKVTASVETVYADASDELKALVAKNAKIKYTGTADPANYEIALDGLITRKASPAQTPAAGDKIPVTMSCGTATEVTTDIYVVPADKRLAKSISLSQKTVDAEFGDCATPVKVTATVLGANGKTPFNDKVTVESSDTSVATVSAVTPANGKNTFEITGVKEGTATITVYSVNKNVKETITVNVTKAEPFKLSYVDDKKTFTLTSGTADKPLKTTYFTEDKETSLGEVEYTATVTAAYDANGKAVKDTKDVLAVKEGVTDDVQVTAGTTEGTAILKVIGTVKDVKNPSITYKQTLEFTVYNVATANQAKAVVFAETKNGKEVAIGTSVADKKYAVGDKFTLTAYGVNKDAGGITPGTVISKYDPNPTDDVLRKVQKSGVTWKSSAPDAVYVDENGNVEIKKPATDVTITASTITSDKTATYTIASAVDLDDIVITPDAYYTKGEDIDLEATDYTAVATYKWTDIDNAYAKLTVDKADSDTGVVKEGEQINTATLSANKVIETIAEIPVTVTVTSSVNPSVTATETVNVYVVPEKFDAVDSVEVTTVDGEEIKDAVALNTNDTYGLKATVKGANNKETVPAVVWSSSDESIATVDANGVVTAVAGSEETVTIKATSVLNKTKYDEVTFTVSDIAAENIALSESTVSLEAGATKNVTVEVKGANDKAATNQAVTVASDNEAVATAKAANGTITVTGVAAGTANIVVTSVANKDVTVTIPVTVTAAPVTPTNPTEVAVSAITLSQSSALLSAGKTVALAATVAPENATNKAVTWTSSDASVATVDANGVVTAVSAGKATITATAGAVSATCDVTVSSVKLNAKTVPLQVKKSTSALKATVSAKEDAVVSWKSSNTKVVKVNAKTGKLTATSKTGTAKITVTTKSGAKATCTVKVQKAKVTTKSIAFAKKSVSLKKGKSVKLTINRNPISATEKITWTSSNKKVATVDKNGKVTGKKAGKATITAKTSNGKKATCKVTVK